MKTIVALVWGVCLIGSLIAEDLRQWTNKEGVSILAKLVSYSEAKKEIIIKKDGRDFTLRLEDLDLSKEDNNFLLDFKQRQEAEQKALSKNYKTNISAVFRIHWVNTIESLINPSYYTFVALVGWREDCPREFFISGHVLKELKIVNIQTFKADLKLIKFVNYNNQEFPVYEATRVKEATSAQIKRAER